MLCLPLLVLAPSFCLFSELPVKSRSLEARRSGIRAPLNYLAGENKEGYVMRKSPIVSLSSVEDMESSVLPTRGIKRGKRELGKTLFLHPLIQNSPKLCSLSRSHFPLCAMPLMLSPSVLWAALLLRVLPWPWL